MTEPTSDFDDMIADRIEITNFIQKGPSKITGQFGTRFDHTNVGKMMFLVEMVEPAGGRLVLDLVPGYEKAIVEAEEAAIDWKVAVLDLVGPCA